MYMLLESTDTRNDDGSFTHANTADDDDDDDDEGVYRESMAALEICVLSSSSSAELSFQCVTNKVPIFHTLCIY